MGGTDLRAAFDSVAAAPVIGSDTTFARSEGRRSYVCAFHGDSAAVFRASDVKGHAGAKSSPFEVAPDATTVHDTTLPATATANATLNATVTSCAT